MIQQKKKSACYCPKDVDYVRENAKNMRSESTDDENSDSIRSHDFSDSEHEFLNFSDCAKSPKYKTEMCKNYSEMGYCPYYERCQFAHGYHDLAFSQALLDRFARLGSRQTRCKNFWKTGQCAYGLRCQFIHYEVSKDTINFLKIQSSVL